MNNPIINWLWKHCEMEIFCNAIEQADRISIYLFDVRICSFVVAVRAGKMQLWKENPKTFLKKS